MATLDLRDSILSDRHTQRLRLQRAASAQIEDWRLPDLPPNPIASPSPEALAVGDRLIEFPNRPSARSGTFVGWGWHKQRGAMVPIVRWDSGYESFSDLKVLVLENQFMNTPHEKPDPLDRLRLECHILIDRIAKRPYSLKLLVNVKKMLLLVLGYKGNRQSLSDCKPPP